MFIVGRKASKERSEVKEVFRHRQSRFDVLDRRSLTIFQILKQEPSCRQYPCAVEPHHALPLQPRSLGYGGDNPRRSDIMCYILHRPARDDDLGLHPNIYHNIEVVFHQTAHILLVRIIETQ